MTKRDPVEVVEGVWAGPGCMDVSELGVDIIISLECSCKARGAPSVCFQLEDFDIKPVDNLEEAILRVREELDLKGHKVYVHCGAGCGRTGTVVSAFLILYREMGYQDALETFFKARGCGPEAPVQVEFLKLLDEYKKEFEPREAIRMAALGVFGIGFR